MQRNADRGVVSRAAKLHYRCTTRSGGGLVLSFGVTLCTTQTGGDKFFEKQLKDRHTNSHDVLHTKNNPNMYACVRKVDKMFQTATYPTELQQHSQTHPFESTGQPHSPLQQRHCHSESGILPSQQANGILRQSTIFVLNCCCMHTSGYNVLHLSASQSISTSAFYFC